MTLPDEGAAKLAHDAFFRIVMDVEVGACEIAKTFMTTPIDGFENYKGMSRWVQFCPRDCQAELKGMLKRGVAGSTLSICTRDRS